MSSEQLRTLAKLRFVFSKSRANEYGVLVAVPNILRRVVKNTPFTATQVGNFVNEFNTINRLTSALQDEEFDFGLLQWRAKKALQTVNIMLYTGITKKSAQETNLEDRTSSLLRESFTEKLSELLPNLSNVLKTKRLVESLAARVQGFINNGETARAESALTTLHRRQPQFPLKTFCHVIVRMCKNSPYPATKKLLKMLTKSGIIFSLFGELGETLPLRTNIAVLWALNNVLRNQKPGVLLRLKDALVDRSLDLDLLILMQKEMRQALNTYRHRESGEPITLYINSLGYLHYQTFADEKRRWHFIELHQKLVVSLMKLMQRFCDNCNEPLQEYVRVQDKDSAFNLNLVTTTADFLITTCMITTAEHLMTPQTLAYLTSAIYTLIEFATGPCRNNQIAIARKVPLYLSLSRLMQTPPDHYYEPSEKQRTGEAEILENNVTALRAAATKLLMTLLEGTPGLKELDLIEKYFDKRCVIDHAKRVYNSFLRSQRRLVETESPSASHTIRKVKTVLEEVCFLITFLQKYKNTSLSSVLVTEEDRVPFRNFYLHYVGYVEIDLNPEAMGEAKTYDDIRDVFFVIPFKAKFLPRMSAEEVVTEVSHESLQERKESFLNSVPMRKREMEHHQHIARNASIKYIISQSYNLKLLSFVLVIVINIALFVYDDKDLLARATYSNGVEIVFVLILGSVQLFSNFLGSVLHSIHAYTKIVDKYTAKDEGMDFEDLASVTDRESQKAVYRNLQETDDKPAPAASRHHLLKGPPAEWRALVLYEENTVAIAYFILSIFALAYPMLYPLLLLQIFDHVSQLRVILQAITYNKSQLIYTALFGVHLLLLFSIICFVWFSNYFTGSADPGPIIFCDSLWDCFTSTIHWGLLSGGGIGEAMGSATAGRYWGRLVFDLIFFIVIIIIMLNIIFGIIIDTFGELREKRNAIAEDINSRCFICGVDRNEIELHGKGWAYHFQNEHSPYAYFAFLVYLTDMKTADCSGVEKYAKQKFEKTDISFIPDTSKMLLQSKVK